MLHYDAASGNWMLKGKLPSSSPSPQQQQRQEAPSPAAAISTRPSLSVAVSGEKETTKQSSSPSPLHTNVDRPHVSAIEHLSPENQQQQQQKFGASSSLAATTSDHAAQLHHHQHSISRGDSAESTVTISPPPPTAATVQRYETTERAAAPASREETAKVEAREVRDRNFTSPHVMRTTTAAAGNRQDVNENRTNPHSRHVGVVSEEKEEVEEEEHLHEVDASLSDSSVTSSLLARFLHRLEKTIAVEGTDPSIQSDAATASAAYHKVLAEKLCEASQRVVQRHLFVPSRAQPTLRSPSPSSSRAASSSSSSTAHHHPHRSISPSTVDHSGSATVTSSVPHFGAQRWPTVLTVVENLSFTPSHGGCNVRRQRPHKKSPSSLVVAEDHDDEGERGFFSQTHLWMGCRDGAVLVFSVESVASSSSSDASPLSEEAGRMREGCALVDTFPFAASPHAVVGPSSRHPTGLGVTSMIYTAANFSKHGGGCFASHPQGVPRFVIVGYGNGTIKWFDARGRRKPPTAGSPDASTCIQTLAQAHNGAVTALLVTLCGRFLLSGSDDGVVVLWDVAVESHATSSRKGGAAAAVAGSSLKPPEHHIVRFLLHATVGGSPNDDVQGGDCDLHHGGQHTAAVVASGGVLCMSQVGSRVFCGGSRRGVLHELDLAKRGIVRLFRDADVPPSPVCQIESIVAPFAMTPHTADTVPNSTTSLFVAPQRPNFLWALHENGIMVVWWLRPVRNTTGWTTTPTVVHRFDLARRSPLLHSGGGGGGVMSRGGVAMDSSHQPMPTTTATAAATTTALQQRKGMPTMYVQCEGDPKEEPTLWVCIEDRLVVVDVSRRMGKALASFDTMSWRSGAEDELRTPVPAGDAGGTAPRRLLVGANGFRSLWICCGLVVPQKAFPPQSTSDVVLLEIHPDLAQREAVSLAAALEWSVVGSRRAPSDWQDLQDRLQRAQQGVSSLETQRNELEAVNAEQRTQLEALAEARLESEQRSHTLTLAVKESIAAFHEQASQRRALQEDLRVVTQERDLLKEETIMLRKAMATLVEQMRTASSSAASAAVVGAVSPRQAAVVQSVADDVGVVAAEESHNEEKRAYDDDFDTASPPFSLTTQPRQSNLPLENADVTTAWDDQEN